ncbi:MAG: hypothetical protein ACE5NC_01635 [Anaerolineae bacterium]
MRERVLVILREHSLAIGWIALSLLFVVAFVWEVSWWHSLAGRSTDVRAEVNRAEANIKANKEAIASELRARSELLREMQQWTVDRGDPSAFLTAVGRLAKGARVKITAIGPLEEEAAAQFRKSWHTVQVVAPYGEFKNLATRIEREGGILEDVSLVLPPQRARREAARGSEIEASFKMTAMELTPRAKAILQRTLAMNPSVSEPPAKAEVLEETEEPARNERNPFAFVGAVMPIGPTKPKAVTYAKAKASKPSMEVKGIVRFPGGYLATVNGRIVKVGDLVDGHRVERITATEVVLRWRGGPRRSVELSSMSAVAGPKRRR